MGSAARSTSAAGSRNLAHLVVIVILFFVVIIIVIVIVVVVIFVFVIPLVVVGVANALFCKEVLYEGKCTCAFGVMRKHGTFLAILFLQLCHLNCSCDISFAVVTLHFAVLPFVCIIPT
jgi:hypothetical protein